MSKLGDRLRQLRGPLSLREAAGRTNGRLSHSTIAQAERGLNGQGKPFTPTAETLTELARVYGADLNELFELAGYNVHVDPSHAPEITIADDYIKVYGDIHAGEAAWAEQDIIGRIPITKEMVMRYGRSNLFALRVVGDSMNQKIPAGFYAVFCKDKEPEPGEIVAVLIDHESATVKQYQRTSQAVIFSPMSYDPRFQPYTFRKDEEQDFEILGTYLFSTDQEI